METMTSTSLSVENFYVPVLRSGYRTVEQA